MAKKGPDFSKAMKESQQTADDLKDAFKSIAATIKDQFAKAIAEANTQSKELLKTLGRDMQDQIKQLEKGTGEVARNIKNMSKGMDLTDDIAEQISNTELKRKQTLKEIRSLVERQVFTASQGAKLGREAVENANRLKAQLKEQLKTSEMVVAQKKLQSQIDKLNADILKEKMGSYAKIMQGITKIPIVGQLIDANKVLEKMKKSAEAGASKWKTLGVGIQETFRSIGETLTNPVFLIGSFVGLMKTLIKLATEYEQKQFDAARDLGVSVDKGKQLRDMFVNISKSNIMLGLTADELQKAYQGVQDEMGIIVKQSAEFNITTAQIMRRTGATAEHMATMQYAALKTGKSLEGAYASIVGAAKAMGAKLKLDMSEKQIMEGISKVSATVLSNLKGNYPALARAVVQATKLGTTLDKINSTQDQFLDFESSISKQFEAQVLTGEELDLTKARQLAEDHNTVGLMQEMNRLIGDRAKWDKLGTIEQQSKAEALGMSRDMLNEMFVTQEKTRLLGAAAGEDLKTQYDYLLKHHATQKQIEDTLGAQAVQSIQQASTAERMATAMEGLKNTVAQLAQTILPLVNKMLEWLSHVQNLKKVFMAISGIIAGIVGYSITLRVLGVAQVATQMTLLQTMIRQNAALIGGLAERGIIAKTEVVTAAADVTATNAAMGNPFALAAGLGVIAALGSFLGMGALGSAAFGGGENTAVTGAEAGGGAPSMTTPAATAPTMAATAAPSANSISSAASGTSTTITANLVVDGQVLASKIIKHVPQNHSAKFDNSTAIT